MDKIILRGVKVETLIGWYEWERQARRPITLDLAIGIPEARARYSDQLADTIDYEKVVNELRRSLVEQCFLLIEALAERVAQIILCEFGAPWVKVTLTKPTSMLTEVACVSIEIERCRGA